MLERFIKEIYYINCMKKDFDEIRKKLSSYDNKREELIKKARELLKISKQIIYSVHRGSSKESLSNINKAKKIKQELDKIASFDKKLTFEGSYSEACQEYVEAFCYYGFVKSLEIFKKFPRRKKSHSDFSANVKIPGFKELGVDHEDYLMGICDLTGELGRKSISLATQRMNKEVSHIKSFVEDIHGEFLKFDLRNGNLRKKADSIKWNLKKLEEVLYDLGRK
jgi:predicted translin family RNA/ssDNA-binding protein